MSTSDPGSAKETTDTPPTSLSGLYSTLLPTFLVAVAYFGVFIYLRKRFKRAYAPRTYLGSIREKERTQPLPGGWFNWIGPFWKIPDSYALQHQSLDAYLFLRFLRLTVLLSFVGACITWPVLFPINATGGGTKQQLDILSMSNINKGSDKGKDRFYAHALCAWLYFGFILVLITRESIFYINLRQAFLLSPVYANRLSSRTVLFTSVPKPYRDEAKLRKVFGDTVRNIWIYADTTNVDELVKERDAVAFKLEGAEVKLIQAVNKARTKALKKGANPDREPGVDVQGAESGSVAARWIRPKDRPTHRLGKYGLYGMKVDTINWARERLETLVPATEAAQASYLAGETEKLGGIFIEFAHQSDAQAAFQTLSHHQALHMSPRYIGVQPSEVIWDSLKIPWWQLSTRRFAVLGLITALVVFWAIPVAFIGLISNISYLENFSWLSWLKKIPTAIMGVISGLLPSVALSILMSLVPVIMRMCAKLAGEPSLARVELFTQNAYFSFQVVQVFLITTIASAASSVLYQLINNPTGITSLLANNIPTASNFYISYFLVQGLTVASGVLAQVVGFLVFRLMYKYFSSTPRKMYNRWTALGAISWGSTLPVYTNIAVISITYSCIAPLVLGFSTIGMALFYLSYRYNILFVTDANIDTKGLIYPRALQQLFTGLYLAEICLIGIFAISTAFGPLILMLAFLVFTVLYQFALNAALDPLLYNLPKSLEYEEECLMADVEIGVSPNKTPDEKNGASSVVPADAPPPRASLLGKFFKPHIYSDYATLRRLVPHDLLDPDNIYEESVARTAYYPPSINAEVPLLWIPSDDAGVSRQEVAHTSKVIGITDEGCTLDEKSKIVWDQEGARPPLWSEKIYY